VLSADHVSFAITSGEKLRYSRSPSHICTHVSMQCRASRARAPVPTQLINSISLGDAMHIVGTQPPQPCPGLHSILILLDVGNKLPRFEPEYIRVLGTLDCFQKILGSKTMGYSTLYSTSTRASNQAIISQIASFPISEDHPNKIVIRVKSILCSIS